jgi:hypothetical protein
MVGRRIFHELNGVLGNVDLHNAIGQSEQGARGILRHPILWFGRQMYAHIRIRMYARNSSIDSLEMRLSGFGRTP